MNYDQAIFNPALKAQQQAAEEHAKTMKLEIDRMRDDVIVRTASAYLELAKVRHSLELLRGEQVSAEKILAVTRERVQANQELSIEVTRSELTAARVQERIIKLEGRDEALTQQLREYHRAAGWRKRSKWNRRILAFETDMQDSAACWIWGCTATATSRKRKMTAWRGSTFCAGRSLVICRRSACWASIQRPQQIQ